MEKLPCNGYLSNGEIDLEMLAVRKAREDEWIKKLRTIYPYGLNEKAEGKETNSNVVHPAVRKLFPPLPRHGSRLSRWRESRNVKTSNLTCDEFFERLEQLLQSDIRSSFNEIRKSLNLAKKKVLKEIAFHILERDRYHFHFAALVPIDSDNRSAAQVAYCFPRCQYGKTNKF